MQAVWSYNGVAECLAFNYVRWPHNLDYASGSKDKITSRIMGHITSQTTRPLSQKAASALTGLIGIIFCIILVFHPCKNAREVYVFDLIIVYQIRMCIYYVIYGKTLQVCM